MKKLFLALILIVIIVCSIFAVPPLLHNAASSQNMPTPTPQNSTQPTPQGTITSPSPSSTSHSTPHNTDGSGQPIPTRTPLAHATGRTIEQAIGNATDYLAQSSEPYAVLNNDMMYRQFGVPQFANAQQKYDQIIAGSPDTILKLFRRTAVHDNPVDDSDFESVTAEVDRITIPALYADNRTLPSDYSDTLQEGLEGGGYLTTHTLLAMLWLQENNGTGNCIVALPANFMDSLYQATAALINNDTNPEDLEIEAAAFLYEAGQGQMVPSSFVTLVIENQNMNGGWAPANNFNPNLSTWHPTFLALLLLLNVQNPSDTPRAWLALPPG